MNELPKIVIVGAGFGGLRAARALRSVKGSITVVDRSNHHLFQPLLYQVATAALSPADIAAPIRSVLHDQGNTQVLMDEVEGIDLDRREVKTAARSIPYDYLVLATGARHGYFGHDDWEANAPGLKTLHDAIAIRQRILLAFESAEVEQDEAKKKTLLTFVVVGGGPTGVELAGAIAELSHRTLAADFRNIDPRSTRVLLVEAGPQILASFPKDLAEKAVRALEHLGVEVMVGSRVEEVKAEGVRINGTWVETPTVLWAAGVVPSPVGKWLGAETDRLGRVKVEKDLSIPGHREVFVIGDTAAVETTPGKYLPGVAPVAMQEGVYVAGVIQRRMKGRSDAPPFRYRNKGNLATVGRRFAIADFEKFSLSGWIAWVAWIVVHIYYLIGFRNRLMVLLQWAWAYITFQRGARLITDTPKP